MIKFTPLLCLLLSGLSLCAQSLIFHENFDLPSGADSVSTTQMGGAPATLWDTTSTLSVSPQYSYWIQGSQSGSTINFETQPFSTIGTPYVKLEFSHIAKLLQTQQAYIYISVDGGQSYYNLDNAQYIGEDAFFPTTAYFNVGSYHTSTQSLWKYSEPLAIPNNSWWKHEIFDLTGVASDTTGGIANATGYADVRLRFVCNFNVPSGLNWSAGWFVDNLKVTGAGCEFNKPELTFNFTTPNCYNHNPKGIVQQSTSNTYPVGVAASDNLPNDTGLDSVAIYYRVNGGSYTGMKMPQVSGSEHRVWLNSIMPGDTVEYHIEAYDLGCPNQSRLPAVGDYMFVVENVPSKCGGVSCGQIPTLVTDFPWKEDFEGSEWTAGSGNGNSGTSHRGNFPDYLYGWGVNPSTVDPWGWSIRTGTTGTTNTGPMVDHTSGNGKYLYSEFSPNVTGPPLTALTTPCIDLRDSVSRMFSFYYHMFGEHTHLLRLDIDTGSSSSSYWINYFSINGEQQTSSHEAYQQAHLNLDPFMGKIIKIRILAFSPNGDLSDIAIDDLQITEPPAVNAGLVEVISPTESPCGSNSNVPVSFHLENLGTDSLNNLSISYQLDNGSIVQENFSNLGLGMADSGIFSFSQQLNFSSQNPHSLKLWLNLAGDNYAENDTLQISLPARTDTVISTFPFITDFEDATVNPGTTGQMPDSSWTLNAQNSGTQWGLYSGLLNNNVEGPMHGLGPGGKLIMTSNFSASATEVEFRSTCMDLSGLSNPELSFNLYLKTGRSLTVRVRELGKSWADKVSITGTGTEKSALKLQRVSLNEYAGKSIQISFYINDPLNNFHNEVALDNIMVKEASQADLSLYQNSGHLLRLPENVQSLPDFVVELVENSSGTSWAGIDLHVQFKDACNAGTPVISGVKGISLNPINSVHTYSINNLSLNSALPAGRYSVKLWVESPMDSLGFNDTLYFESIVFPTLTAPYFNDFEACEQQFKGRGPLRQWEKSTGGAFSGSHAFETNADGPLVSGSGSEQLLLPFFSNLDTIYGARLRFRHKLELYGNLSTNFGRIEYFKGGSWKNLLESKIFSPFFTSPYLNQTSDGYEFNGSTNGNWDFMGFPLEHIKKNGGVTALRFITNSSNTANSNWAIDDLEIYVPPQHSASPVSLSFTQGIPQKGANVIAVTINNTGASPLEEVQFEIRNSIGNILLNEHISFNKSLAEGDSIIINLQDSLNLTTGSTQLLLITSLPDNRADQIPVDDSLVLNVKVLAPAGGTPYCVDFEANEEFLPFNYKSGFTDDLWSYGTPAKSLIQTPHSGQAAWVTDLTNDYPALADRHLVSPLINTKDQTCYRLSFWHQYKTEFNFDGGNVEYSLDTGKTWIVLGNYGDSAWYNTPYVQSLDLIHPGFSGNSGGWVKAFKEFEISHAGSIQFRFRFASNASRNGEGWAIDDVCFEEVSTSCQSFTTAEFPLSEEDIILYPNPVVDLLKFRFSADVEGDAHAEFKIFDQRASLVKKWTQSATPGADYELDLSLLPPGVYIFQVRIGEQLINHSFIKS